MKPMFHVLKQGKKHASPESSGVFGIDLNFNLKPRLANLDLGTTSKMHYR